VSIGGEGLHCRMEWVDLMCSRASCLLRYNGGNEGWPTRRNSYWRAV
jgi:hypothetical protein